MSFRGLHFVGNYKRNRRSAGAGCGQGIRYVLIHETASFVIVITLNWQGQSYPVDWGSSYNINSVVGQASID